MHQCEKILPEDSLPRHCPIVDQGLSISADINMAMVLFNASANFGELTLQYLCRRPGETSQKCWTIQDDFCPSQGDLEHCNGPALRQSDILS